MNVYIINYTNTTVDSDCLIGYYYVNGSFIYTTDHNNYHIHFTGTDFNTKGITLPITDLTDYITYDIIY